MAEQRKKPIKIGITGGILSSTPEDAVEVRIKGAPVEKSTSAPNHTSPTPLRGSVKLRREVKGRAGKPVSVLFGFDDPAARNFENIRALQSRLKEMLACGGTADAETLEVILQVDDLARVRQALVKLGFHVKG